MEEFKMLKNQGRFLKQNKRNNIDSPRGNNSGFDNFSGNKY